MLGLKNVISLASLCVVALAVAACDRNSDLQRDLEQFVGHWVAEYSYDGSYHDITGEDEYQFHYNKTGTYYKRNRQEDFEWDLGSNSSLVLTFFKNQNVAGSAKKEKDREERYFYSWDDEGDLMLSSYRNMRIYNAYRYKLQR